MHTCMFALKNKDGKGDLKLFKASAPVSPVGLFPQSFVLDQQFLGPSEPPSHWDFFLGLRCKVWFPAQSLKLLWVGSAAYLSQWQQQWKCAVFLLRYRGQDFGSSLWKNLQTNLSKSRTVSGETTVKATIKCDSVSITSHVALCQWLYYYLHCYTPALPAFRRRAGGIHINIYSPLAPVGGLSF